MALQKGKDILHNYAEAVKNEWLETNGLGGYASATVIGTNTRRYHGLLVAATRPPVGKVSLLSRLDEAIITGNQKYFLATNKYADVVDPHGYRHISGFKRDLFPEWTYSLDHGIELKKTIAAVHNENTTLVLYEVLNANDHFTLELLPLVSGRDFHSLTHANNKINKNVVFENAKLCLKPYDDLPEFFISAPEAEFALLGYWYYNFEYPVEKYRGQDCTEDLYACGTLRRELKKGDKFGILISTEDPGKKDAFRLYETEKARREKLVENCQDEMERILSLAADQFIVKRGGDLKTIIAGYHWFSDWGRDTMISLPGICLATRRFDDAKKILSAFAKSVDQGMLPNRFPDYGEKPEYNTVDATLWFFIAIKKYLDASGDNLFVLNELLPVLKDIISWHYKGTRFNIHSNNDGLLYQGEAGQQLTWMDARVGNWVVTPRIGKTVEVNALWYNALSVYASLLRLNGENSSADIFELHALKIKNSFSNYFWNNNQKCLYDNIDGDLKDPSIRPNQLFALCLPYPLIDGDKAKAVLKVVEEKLYTPVGLRSLSMDHPDYKGNYGGDQLSRDGAYHQGTVWSWLLGPYLEAIIKVKGKKGISEAKEKMKIFSYHFNEGCIGSISEIFDGNAPHTPRGCVAQAWSVGELLRVASEFGLFAQKKRTPALKKRKAGQA